MPTDDTVPHRDAIGMAFDGQSVHRAIERPRIKQSATGTAFVLPRDNESKPLLFLHVPKTAGSSVYSIFRTNLKPPELLKLHLDGKSLARLTALPRRQASRLRMLYGHVDVQLARQIVPLQQCVTLLRDPVDRLISFYAFAKHMNSGPHSELARRTTITQWIDALCLPETDNGMVRRLSGAFPEAAIGRCSRQMLERAKANLAQFALIGLTHRFDEFYALLASRLGLAMRTFVVSKVNAMRPRFDQLHADTLAELEQRSALDRELYRFAEGLFLRQLSKVDLSMKIADFRFRCSDRSMRIRDAARRIAFARWKRVRSHWSPYPFLG